MNWLIIPPATGPTDRVRIAKGREKSCRVHTSRAIGTAGNLRPEMDDPVIDNEKT